MTEFQGNILIFVDGYEVNKGWHEVSILASGLLAIIRSRVNMRGDTNTKKNSQVGNTARLASYCSPSLTAQIRFQHYF